MRSGKAFFSEEKGQQTFGCAVSVPWWSFGKTVLAAGLVRLAEMGRIDLDAAIVGRPYTAAQLLRHESGLPDYGDLSAYHEDVAAGRLPWPVGRLLRATEADRLRFAPGEGWAYSNIGYWHVARLIETVSDRPVAEALADLVFRPAGLVSARLARVPADLDDVCMGSAVGYHPGWVYHGLVVGTTMDAARLLHMLLAGRLVGPDALARMLQARPLPQFRSAENPDPAYGLGLMLQTSGGRAGHSGAGPGSTIEVYQEHGQARATWTES